MKTRLLLPACFLFTAATLCAAEPDKGFTVHEWGTFTSVQGSDGVQMGWNPLVISDLPKFVYDSARVRAANSPTAILVGRKSSFVCRQRMETPVLYFYSDRTRTVDVSVRFPHGTITEWYPDETATDLSRGVPAFVVKNDLPALHWKQVQILPSDDSVSLLKDESGSHYYAARETDASLLRTTTNKKTETEKFLFYRGVADFTAPLTVRLGSSDPHLVTLSNTGSEELRHLFLYEVLADGSISWTPVNPLAPGQTQRVMLINQGWGAEAVTTALRSALMEEGLFEKEAAAMVKTWESSWFSERGMRVLYVLPRTWADRTLPLAIAPAPTAIERVMVGRAEIITPLMESALLGKIESYIAAKPEDRPRIVAETRALGLGRFTDAVLRRLSDGVKRSADFYLLSQQLLQAASAPPRLDVKLDVKTLTEPSALPDFKSLNK